jgi:hypothetical protein
MSQPTAMALLYEHQLLEEEEQKNKETGSAVT